MIVGVLQGCASPGPAVGEEKNGFLGNDVFISGLSVDLDMRDSMAVFRYVFSNLADEVDVLPTENYYYFRFPANGKEVWGALSLFAEDRDQGNLGFGYSEKVNKNREQYMEVRGGGGEFNAAQGVRVHKIDDFNYEVSFEGKTVTFHLNQIGLEPPPRNKMAEGEVFVGPCQDESGLKFFLLYNQLHPKLYWMLNEEEELNETFTNELGSVVIGDRTEFAFFNDTARNRKILVGVEGRNVLQNNWYDGPFDQLPENYVKTGQIDLRKYIEPAYPQVRGRISPYARYLDGDGGSRIAVAPYTVYFQREDLRFVDDCLRMGLSAAEFFACITRQVYEIPEDFYYPESIGGDGH